MQSRVFVAVLEDDEIVVAEVQLVLVNVMDFGTFGERVA
jgi:hypothetical protein